MEKYLLFTFTGLFIIIVVIIQSCGGNSKKEDKSETQKTITEQLIDELKANHGEFLYFRENKEHNRIDLAYGFKGGLDKPDLFKREINKILNMLPTKANDKSEMSYSGKSVELAQYTWETPQFKIDLNASVRIGFENPEGNISTADTDSVFVRLWIEQN